MGRETTGAMRLEVGATVRRGERVFRESEFPRGREVRDIGNGSKLSCSGTVPQKGRNNTSTFSRPEWLTLRKQRRGAVSRRVPSLRRAFRGFYQRVTGGSSFSRMVIRRSPYGNTTILPSTSRYQRSLRKRPKFWADSCLFRLNSFVGWGLRRESAEN